MNMSNWFNEDKLFRSLCKTGHEWERYVAAFLKLQGLQVDLTPQKIRDHVSQRAEYENTIDLSVNGIGVECKSRSLAFLSPLDFPYEDILVDTVGGWEKKDPPPRLLLCVSQWTGAMIVTDALVSKPFWTKATKHDNTRHIEDAFYEAPRRLWLPLHLVTPLLHEGMDSEDFRARCEAYHGHPVDQPPGPAEDPGIDDLDIIL